MRCRYCGQDEHPGRACEIPVFTGMPPLPRQDNLESWDDDIPDCEGCAYCGSALVLLEDNDKGLPSERCLICGYSEDLFV